MSVEEKEPPKKVVSKTIAMTIGIVCIILAVGLAGAVVVLANHHFADSEYYFLEHEVDRLREEINGLRSPLIALEGVSCSDVRPSLRRTYLHLNGTVWNLGTVTAYNCRIHVVMYQGNVTDRSIANDTYVNLGTIEGRSLTAVDAKILYLGRNLTDWIINSEST